MARSRSLEPVPVLVHWTERLWETTISARYFGIAALALTAALVPQFGPRRLALAATVLLIGMTYNFALQQRYRVSHRLPSFMPYTDIFACLLFPPLQHLTFIPTLLVMVTAVALAVTGIGRREALIASVLGVVGLTVIVLAFGLPNGLVGIAGFAIAAGMVVATVGAVADSERQVRARFGSLVEGLDAIIWERDPVTHRYTYVTARAEQTLGYPVAAWLEEGFWLDHVHPDDRVHVTAETQLATHARCRRAGGAPARPDLLHARRNR